MMKSKLDETSENWRKEQKAKRDFPTNFEIFLLSI